jgi:chemotaxis protein CheD
MSDDQGRTGQPPIRPYAGTERRRSRPLEAVIADQSIRRYRDPAFDAVAVKVRPGECYVTRCADEMLVTVLGSCVAACIRDPLCGVGGMNHFMLPETFSHGCAATAESLLYGNVAMTRLIDEVLACGGVRARLEVKVFGGAHVLGCALPIGQQNAAFVESYLKGLALPIAAAHLRGERARRVHYFPLTGDVYMLEMRRQEDLVVFRNEEDSCAGLLPATPDPGGKR